MPLLNWDESYNVGIVSLDAQHYGLIATANRLHEAVQSGRSATIQRQILGELADAAQTHFEREERVMQIAGYPRLQRHRESHARFAERITGYAQSSQTEGEPLSEEATRGVGVWLQSHMREQDAAYVAWIRGGQRRKQSGTEKGESQTCHS